jgi:hypothetical protein
LKSISSLTALFNCRLTKVATFGSAHHLLASFCIDIMKINAVVGISLKWCATGSRSWKEGNS